MHCIHLYGHLTTAIFTALKKILVTASSRAGSMWVVKSKKCPNCVLKDDCNKHITINLTYKLAITVHTYTCIAVADRLYTVRPLRLLSLYSPALWVDFDTAMQSSSVPLPLSPPVLLLNVVVALLQQNQASPATQEGDTALLFGQQKMEIVQV